MMILVKGIAPENLWRYKKPIIKAESELGLQFDLVISSTIKDIETFNMYDYKSAANLLIFDTFIFSFLVISS